MILELLSLIILIVTAAGFLRAMWWFDVLDFFRLQYACVALLLLCIALYDVDFISASLNILSLILNIYRMRHFMPRLRSSDVSQNKDVLSINAFEKNIDFDSLKDAIHGADPQLLLIMEITDEIEAALRDVLKLYKHKLQTPVRDGFNICLFSKNPLEETEISIHGSDGTPFLQAQTTIHSQPYQVFCAHPKPALSKDWHKQRSIYFDEVAPIIARADLPVLVLGDFNAVPWEDKFQAFLQKTNLKSTLEGYGYKITWPVFFPVMGVPMDHILVTKDQAYSDLNVGPYAGSDHFPISINLGSSGT